MYFLMRGIILHCNRIAFQDTEYSTRQGNVEDYRPEFKKQTRKEVVLVFLCIEKGDTLKYLKSAVDRVDFMNTEFKLSNKIFVMPFAHLSNQLEEPGKSIEMISRFAKNLENCGYAVQQGTFGTHKEALFHIKGHPTSVSYFEFPYTEWKCQ